MEPRPVAIEPARPVPGDAQPSPQRQEGAAWRLGDDRLAVATGATLPSRCARCGAEGVDPARMQKMHWHPPWVYLLLLGGVLPYAIAAMAVRRAAFLQYFLCLKHKRRVQRAPIAAALLAVLGAGVLLAGCDQMSFPLQLVGMAWIAAAGVVVAVGGGSPLSAAHIDDAGVAVVKGAHRDLLALLPAERPAWMAEGTFAAAVSAAAPAVPPSRFWAWWTTRNTVFVALGFIALAIGGLLGIAAATSHCQVTFDNPSNQPLELRIDFARVGIVPPGQSLALELEGGREHHLQVLTAQGEGIEDEFAVPDPGPVESFEAIYDISGVGRYAFVTVSYCNPTSDCTQPPEVTLVPDVWYFAKPLGATLDAPFPETVQMDQYQHRTTRTHLCRVAPDGTTGC